MPAATSMTRPSSPGTTQPTYTSVIATAAVHIVVSSIQLVSEQHGFEKWSNFPAARAKLVALLDELSPSNTVVLSGDRHFAELSMLDRGPGKAPLYDLTSSSLAKPWLKAPEEPNRHRVGEMVWGVNFGLIELDWAGDPAVMRLQIHDQSGAIGIEQVVPLQIAEAPMEITEP